MAIKRGLLTFVNLSVLLLTVVSGELIVTPLNTATNSGGQTFFNCSSNINAGAIMWIHTTDCNSATSGVDLTVSNCDLNTSFASHYRIEKTDGNLCNLVVHNALLSLRGCYLCSDGGSGTSRQRTALLVIVESNYSRPITTNSTESVSGEDLTISSNVSYRGPSFAQQLTPLPPSFYWTLQSDRSQNISSYTGMTTNTRASSYIIVTAQPPEIPRYECHLFFNPPVDIPVGCASNAPTYTDVTITPIYNVSYPPQNIDIAGYPTTCPLDENEGVTMMCNASGYPPPSYTWIDLAIPGVILSESSTITIRRDGIYQCTASNVIRGVNNAISTVANVSDCQCHSNCPPYDETAVIVLGVILAISLVINTGLVTWTVCWRLPKERTAPGSMSRGPDDNSSRQAAYDSTTKPETLAYETLEHAAAAAAYQELALEQKSDIDA